MAIHERYDVATLLGTPELSLRVDNFVWTYLSQVVPNPDLWNSTCFPRQMCWELLNDNPLCLQDVRRVVNSGWIPERELIWITDSLRQAVWVQRYVQAAMQYAQSASQAGAVLIEGRIPLHLTGASRSVALMDYWSARSFEYMERRRESIKATEIEWARQTAADRSFDWLDVEDLGERRMYFWGRLMQSFPGLVGNRPAPESHESLLVALDQCGVHPSDLKLFTQRARALFQQQVRRASSVGRRQCNFVLQDKTINILEKLAREHGITRTEVIEFLIQDEAKNPVHTKERLRKIRALTALD